MTRVVLVKTKERAAGVRRALELLKPPSPSGQDVLLKPNFNSPHPAPGSTHSDVLRTLVSWFKETGARTITVADRSGIGNTRRVMEEKGVFDLGREMGFQVLALDEMEKEDWEPVQVPGGHWRDGFYFARIARQAPYIVQTCNLKTHRFGGHFTLSLKNTVGLVAKTLPGQTRNYMFELHSSPSQRLMIAEINTAYTPTLILLDGLEAFVEGGPEAGKSVEPGVILAGTDRVAIDAVGVAILRHLGTTREVSRGRIFQQEQIARAVELGLGVDSPQKIDLATPDNESADFAETIGKVLVGG
jgi:uncharacterized protein (DUF362 family)